VHRRVQTIHVGEDLVGGSGPDKGLGIVLVGGDVAIDRGLQIDDRVEAAAADAAAGERREEALDGIEPRARGRREVEDPAGMARQPGHDLGMLVGGIVVEDRVDHPAGPAPRARRHSGSG
jgi:hypothetical protein